MSISPLCLQALHPWIQLTMDRTWEEYYMNQIPLWSLFQKNNTVKQLSIKSLHCIVNYVEPGGNAKCLRGCCTYYMQILDHFISGCSHLQDQGVLTILIETTPVVVSF